MKRWLAGFVVVVALVVWWSLAHRANAPTVAPVSLEPRAAQLDSAHVPLAADASAEPKTNVRMPLASSSGTVPSSTGSSTREGASRGSAYSKLEVVTVRSSLGIPITSLEVVSANTKLAYLHAKRNAPNTFSLELPCHVRAPGHIEANIGKSEREVVLEPDAVFVVRARGLRSRFPKASCTDIVGRALDRNTSDGFLDEDRWAVAVDIEREASDVGDPSTSILARAQPSCVHFELGSKIEGTIIGTCFLSHGARITWDAPIGDPVPCAPLVVNVKSDEPEGHFFVSYKLTSIDAKEMHDVQIHEAWGDASLPKEPRVQIDMTDKRIESPFTIASVPLGMRLGLDVSHSRRWASGYSTFVHDGSPRTIEFQDEPVVHMTVKLHTVEDWVQVTWRDPNGGRMGFAQRRMEQEQEHRFEFDGWTQIPRDRDLTTPLADELLVVVSAIGHEQREVRVARTSPNTFDCGLVELAPFTPAPWLFVSDLAIDTDVVSEVHSCCTDVDPQVWFDVYVGDEEERGYPVYLHSLRDPSGLVKVHRYTSNVREQWADEPRRPNSFLQLDTNSGAYVFARSESGQYTAVPTSKFRVHLKLPDRMDAAGAFTASWKWRHLFSGSTFNREKARWNSGDVFELQVPTEGTELLWWDDRDRENVHHLELDRAEIELDAR
jgi:hypothetical protein